MRSERFTALWSRADVRCRAHGPKSFVHPLVGTLDLHQENFVVPDNTGVELVTLSAAPGSEAHDGLRLLASLGATDEREREIFEFRPST